MDLALLGFLIAPWTTLAWVLCAPGGIVGFDYFLIGMAVLVDLLTLAGNAVVPTADDLTSAWRATY